MAELAEIGVTGLAVMGRNLARNFARHGHRVAIHNRTYAKTQSLVDDHGRRWGPSSRASRWPTSSPRWSGRAGC